MSATSTDKPSTSGTAQPDRISELDLNNAARGVWLVKVPKYISTRWEKAPSKTEVGKLQISKGAGGQPEIKFILSEELIKIPVDKPNSGTGSATGLKDSRSPANAKAARGVKANLLTKTEAPMTALGAKQQPKNSLIGTKKDVLINKDELKDLEIPREHKFAISDISHQHLAVFSHCPDDKGARKLVLEGNVVQKGECRPIGDSLYMDLKKQRIVEARQPTRLVQQLDKAVVNYKPLISQRIETEPKRKNEQKKSREDKDKVTEMLFAAFEKHQYYYLKDLERITKQPITYLKEILREIASYNLKNPHKNMWELKAEYRHYKDDK
jgi:transcription initiation factor TFIIF subunit beta